MSDNKLNYLKFEHHCVNKHSIDYSQKTYHWSVIPDNVLIKSGYFESEEELRQKRKNNKNLLREYGLDAISIENNNDTEIYHGLQVKLWNSNSSICANDLGTFTSVIFHRFSELSKGYLYHTSKLEHTFENDIKKKNKIIPIKLDNPYINENIDNNEQYFPENTNNNISKPEQTIYLRYYQLEAINKLKQNWNGIKLLVFPCGTGKTVTFSDYLKQCTLKTLSLLVL
jgi:hypothetical protein